MWNVKYKYNPRAKEGVSLLVKEGFEWHVKQWRAVSLSLMWMRMTLGCERWVFVAAYGPGSDQEC